MITMPTGFQGEKTANYSFQKRHANRPFSLNR
jgi:hypothetical protein